MSFSPKLASLRTPTGITPLYQAYDLAALDIADILITHGGADINATGKKGDLLAFWLVSESDDAEVAAHLVNHQLDLFKRNAKDQTLIEVAYEAGNKVMAAQLGKAYEAILQQYEKKLQAQHENNATKGKQSR